MDKRYEEALERAKMILCNLPEGSSSARDIETIFPELMGDEEMLEFMRNHFYNLVKRQDENERMYTRCLVYIDKLKEQKAIQDSVAVVTTSRPTISKFEAGKAEVLNNPEEYGLRTINKWAGSKRGLPPGTRTMFPIKGDDDKDLDLALDILQRTLGQVDGYQSDDGILEHKKAIMAVTDAMNAKPADWTDADQEILERIINRQKFTIPVPGKGIIGVMFKYSEDAEAINWLKRRVTSQPQPKQEWSKEDEKQIRQIERIVKNAGCTKTLQDKIHNWFKSLLQHHTIRWRRATEGANLPESIIIPDGEEPRFGKCAVKDSYYIPVEELKELPKE